MFGDQGSEAFDIKSEPLPLPSGPLHRRGKHGVMVAAVRPVEDGLALVQQAGYVRRI